MIPCLVVVGWAGQALAQAGTGTVRVAPGGSNQPACGSIATPCQTIQYAIDRFPLPGSGTVLVAAGTYTGTDPDRVVRVTRRDITLQGGYTPAFTTSAPATQVVTIDGQNVRKAILVDCVPGSGEACRLELVGVTLTRGFATPDNGTLNAFGGCLDAFAAEIELVDVQVVDCEAHALDAASGLPGDAGGGGLAFRQTTASLLRVSLSGNTARGGHGTGSAFRGGLGVGGGIFSFQSTVTLEDTTATGNVAEAGDAPGGLGSFGIQRADGLGGFWALIDGSGTANDVTATGNQALGGGAASQGGLGLGGAIFFQIVPSATLAGLNLRENQALGGTGSTNLGAGGGLFAEDAVVTLDRSRIVGNHAQGSAGTDVGGTGAGGGIYMNSVLEVPTSLAATNVVVAGNTVVAGSGSTPGFAFGGGIFVQCPGGACGPASATNDATLLHVTLADNAVSGAEFNQGAALYVNANATATSDFGIVSGHTTPMTASDRGEAVLTWGATTLRDTLWNDNTLKSFAAPGGTFADLDPLAGDPDFLAPGAPGFDYHLGPASAALDAALGSTTPVDVDGEPRPAPGGAPDLGADERTVPEPGAGVAGAAALAAIALAGRLRRPARRTGLPPARAR